MLTNLKLSHLRQSIKQLNIKTPAVLSSLRQIKKYLPAASVILVLITGLIVGKKIASLSNRSINIPKPAALPNTTTPTPKSNLTHLKQSVEQFNPHLPDPIIPQFSDAINLQETED